MKNRDRFSLLFLYLFLGVVAILTIVPFYWGVVASFRTIYDLFSPSLILRHPTIENYRGLLLESAFPRWFFNSSFIAFSHTGLALFFCSLAGFAFAKYTFRGKEVLFLIVLSSMMIPVWAILVPLYVFFWKLKALNHYWILIVPGSANPLGIFLMRQYIHAIPSELIDTARIDGCSDFRIYYSVILPLIKPAMGALAIIVFMFSWNSFILPLVFMQEQAMFTVPVGLASLLGLTRPLYNWLIAGALLSVIPAAIIFIRMQRELIAGLVLGAVKG